MELPVGLCHIFAQTRLYTDGREYVIVSAPLESAGEAMAVLQEAAEPFSVAVVDKDELTLVLSADACEALQDDLDWVGESGGYRLITFDVPLDLGLVGYLATLVHVVAEAGVSLLAFSAYQRDHVLVPQQDFERAWTALSEFVVSCQAAELTDKAGD
jgi:hypothetical protein